MKPDFPSLIITPRTPHRIPWTTGAEDLMDRLREHDVNASAFLMDADLLARVEGFQNNRDLSVNDLLDQLPAAIIEAVFGDKKDGDDGGSGGEGSGGGGGSGGSGDDDGDGDDSPMDQGMGMSPPGHESPSRKQRQREEEERRRLEEEEHDIGRSIGGM